MVSMFQPTTTTKPITIPGKLKEEDVSYREIIKQLAAQTATKPYGDIPPMLSKRKKKKTKKEKSSVKQPRRMSHVEDWIEIDSKGFLPDEEELVKSPIRNFLFGDFLTEVLPLHVPPPSLSNIQQYDEEEDDDDDLLLSKSWKSDEISHQKELLRRHSVSSFHNKSITSIASHAISSSPPHLSNSNPEIWKTNLAKLLSKSPPNKKLIPMPKPPKRPTTSQKRRSEATTQPRFNPETNTYLRDTRYNPDHLRMISAELNMMRKRKLLSPLKPRGFLPRRKDSFLRGENRKLSPLINQVLS